MVVTLYTSRIVLKYLGVEDFGIYSVIGSVVISFSFISTAMTQAVQRFLSFELGCNNIDGFNKILSLSLLSYIMISILMFVIFETIGLWFLINYLTIPPDRMDSALWTFHLSVLTFVLSIFKIPYNAAIIAYEKMSFFAICSIFEAIMKLAVVFLLGFFVYDKLIVYAALLLLVAILMNIIYYLYCKFRLEGCGFKFHKDTLVLKQLLKFSGWSTLGGFSTAISNQGLNILLNIFLGVVVNAGMGIANQVSYAINLLVTNFQMAFNPQIVKSYASHNWEYLNQLMLSTSKISFFLLFLTILPLFIYTPECLSLWLVEVPPYSIDLCRIILISLLIDSLSGPLWMCIQATGKIKNYQIILSFILIGGMLIAWILLKMEFNLYTVVAIKILSSLSLLIFRLVYVNKSVPIILKGYFEKVILKIGKVCAISVIIPIIIFFFVKNKIEFIGYHAFFMILIVSLTLFCIYFIGLNLNEKLFLKEIIKKVTKRK